MGGVEGSQGLVSRSSSWGSDRCLLTQVFHSDTELSGKTQQDGFSTSTGKGQVTSHRVSSLLPLSVISSVDGQLQVRQSALQRLLLVVGVVVRLF